MLHLIKYNLLVKLKNFPSAWSPCAGVPVVVVATSIAWTAASRRASRRPIAHELFHTCVASTRRHAQVRAGLRRASIPDDRSGSTHRYQTVAVDHAFGLVRGW